MDGAVEKLWIISTVRRGNFPVQPIPAPFWTILKAEFLRYINTLWKYAGLLRSLALFLKKRLPNMHSGKSLLQ
jgi:hypothetical protein